MCFEVALHDATEEQRQCQPVANITVKVQFDGSQTVRKTEAHRHSQCLQQYGTESMYSGSVY